MDFLEEERGNSRLHTPRVLPSHVSVTGGCKFDEGVILDDFETGWADELGGFSGYTDG